MGVWMIERAERGGMTQPLGPPTSAGTHSVVRRAATTFSSMTPMATSADLLRLGFQASVVAATQLNIAHPAPVSLGPFCRLAVTTTAPAEAGVYAWVVDDIVSYVGRASHLIHVVQGTRFQRAYQDYTYVPRSKVSQASSPRVRINGLLNRAIGAGQLVTWWWLATETVERSKRTAAELIDMWSPPWNIARPVR